MGHAYSQDHSFVAGVVAFLVNEGAERVLDVGSGAGFIAAAVAEGTRTGLCWVVSCALMAGTLRLTVR